MAYNWSVLDVFQLLQISTNRSKAEVTVPCPFCGSKRFGMNQQKGTGHCWQCGQSADSASYYAAMMGLSIEEARRDIERRLNIKDEGNYVRPERIVFKEAEQQPMAKISVLDATYRAFLAELTLSEKNKNALLARGFSESDIQFLGYKTFPKEDQNDFKAICRRLLVAGYVLKGVPGFFQDSKGDWTFIRCTQGIILPQRTVNNEIFGFQIRKDDDLRVFDTETGKLEAKCIWFSSKNCRNGCSSMAHINFSCDFKFDTKTEKYWPYFANKKVVLTEGSLKADLIHCLKPDWPIISVAGVKSTAYLDAMLKTLKKLGVEAVLHAYDMDYKVNPHVAEDLEKTKKIICDNGMNYKMAEWNTDIIMDGVQKSLLKGLDDYLAYIEKGVIPKVVEK